VQHEIRINEGTGSTVSNLRIPLLEALQIPRPPLSEQRAIASILGAIDDKIELNRRMNETLEGLARALFKSWFVDFDPVRAKAAGRQPVGMDAETAKLFPDKFVETEMGPMPKGWRLGKFGEIAANPRRTARPSDLFKETAYVALEHIPKRSIALSVWSDASAVESNKSYFGRGSILFGKLRPYFHKVVVAPIAGVCSTDILVIEPATADWFGFALGHASSDEMIAHADRASGGTKMPRTSWGDVARLPVALPPTELARVHTDVARPLVAKIEANVHEARTLTALRDAVLPKLLSGELRAHDVKMEQPS
jgi:type I restriction enzyme S subunit